MIYLLNSGGKDSNFFSNLLNCYCLFLKISNDCNNYLDLKYSYNNNFILNKFLYIINLKKEYNFFIKKIYKKTKNFNLDYFCNKFIKILLLIKLLKIKYIYSGHYIKKIKKYYVISNDRKKDQIYFINIKNNIYSILGYINKINLFLYLKKNNIFYYLKKNTNGICFKFLNKKIFYYYIILLNNMIIKYNFFIFKLNVGKKINNKFILKIKKNYFFIGNNIYYNIIFYNKKHFIKNIKIKLRSQNNFFVAKIIKLKKTFIILYKKKKFINVKQNLVILYNDLILSNFIIKIIN